PCRGIERRRHSAGPLLANLPEDPPPTGAQGFSGLGVPHCHADLISLLETAKALARLGERSGIDSLDSGPRAAPAGRTGRRFSKPDRTCFTVEPGRPATALPATSLARRDRRDSRYSVWNCEIPAVLWCRHRAQVFERKGRT